MSKNAPIKREQTATNIDRNVHFAGLSSIGAALIALRPTIKPPSSWGAILQLEKQLIKASKKVAFRAAKDLCALPAF